jgi:hypothetical protein
MLILLLISISIALLLVPLTAVSGQQNGRPIFGVTREGTSNSRTEVINYTRKTESSSMLHQRHFPPLTSMDPNGCAPLAAAGILTYYAQWFPALVQGHTVFSAGGGFHSNGPAINNAVLPQLTNDMGGTANGVTVPRLQSGLSAYCSRFGFRTQYVTSMRRNTFLGITVSNNFCFELYRQQIYARRPVLLAADRWHTMGFGNSVPNSARMNYTYRTSQRAHGMVGYGYRLVHYYRMETFRVADPVWYNPFRTRQETREVRFRTDQLLMVAAGGLHTNSVLIDANYHFRAFDAFGVWVGR